MDSQALHTSISAGAVAACAECGSASRDRQYVRVRDRHTCEHCLLDARKRLGGLKHDPYELFVESLAEALDLRERETGLHSKRVAANTLLLATHHFQKPSDLKEVYWGSLLHDIGKIGVPDAILLKAGQLTEQEWQIMREHPYNGHLILQKLSFLSMAANIVLCHEERFDGSGYPAGLKGEQIPLAARLFAVIDTLDAMTFDRPYRKALPFDYARKEILRMSGTQFDPVVVETFLLEEAALREMTAMEFPPMQ
jgi:HD-GYP domain-containing protein (c-di-GMP phosphodiesterase class II)